MKTIIIYSGYNQRAVISFLRYANKKRMVVFIIACGKDDAILKTSYKQNVAIIRKDKTLNAKIILDHVNYLRKLNDDKDVFVLPTTEYINRILVTNYSLFKDNNVSFGLCNEELYQKLSDKRTFTDLCLSHEICVPKESNTPFSVFPQVAKPKYYFEGDQVASKPIIITDEDELIMFKKYNNTESFFYQEYINGKCVYLLFNFNKSGSYSVYSQENLIQQPNGGSMILAKSADYHENREIVEPYIDLFLSERFHGLVMVEIKIHNDVPYMIEANPRFWGPSQLILDSEMTLFDDFAFENDLISDYTPTNMCKKEVYYYWSGGIFQAKTNSILFHNYDKELFNKDFFEFSKNDVYMKKDTIQIFIEEQGIKL